MYSLSTEEKRRAAHDESSAREILWKNLRDHNKSGRMVCRIYDKSREDMARRRQDRCQAWIARSIVGAETWAREPQASPFQHTFRDRKPEQEIGPANGHVSGRKYIPRLVLSGGGELEKEKMRDLARTLSLPSRIRGNLSSALHNPCRPTIDLNDTAKIRGRLDHPHWEPPRYFLRNRDKAKEIGPDVQYADRNDMQRIFSGVVKNSLFAWGPYEGGGPWNAASCRQPQTMVIVRKESTSKWIGDAPFNPGYRYRDNQREAMAGARYSADLLNSGDYRPRRGFSRDRHLNKELPQHGRFRLVVRRDENVCPADKTRRRLRFEEAPRDAYPEEKTYAASLRSVPITAVTDDDPRAAVSVGSNLRQTASAGILSEAMNRVERQGRTTQERCQIALWPDSAEETLELKPRSRATASVRFRPNSVRLIPEASNRAASEEEHVGGSAQTSPHANDVKSTIDAKVAGGMRRGSEMVTWVTSGVTDKSARDYLW